jgi:hypothetical protein
VLCGYLDPDLKSVADDILVETHPEPLGEIQARDLRKERVAPPPPEPDEPDPGGETQPYLDYDFEEEDYDTSELEPIAVAGAPEVEPEPEPPPEQPQLDGVTASDDWAHDEPEDYAGPA